MNLADWLAGLNPLLLNAATFGLMLLEGAGVPGVPGVLPMLAQSALIGAGRSTLAEAIIWGVAGNWLGSLLGYALGRWGGRWLPERWRAAIQQPRPLALLARWGGPLIVVSRTIGSLRTPVTLGAGMVGYPWPRYLWLSLLGALIHVGVWQTLLWRFGPAIIGQIQRFGGWGLLALAGLAAALWLLRRWWRARHPR